MDYIFIEEFRCKAHIGVYDWERSTIQMLEFTIQIGCPLTNAAKRKTLENGVDYSFVVKLVETHLKENTFVLLETLAEELAGLLFQQTPADTVRLKIAKLARLPNVKKVGVELYRERETT